MSQHDFVDSAMRRFADSDHLDVHFEANRVAYTTLLHQVGLQRGSHVLDAGAGSGSYLPLIAHLVGESGRITALDLSTENVAMVRERLPTWDLPCPIEVIEGSILDLPFGGDQFDAIWCANTSQFLSDDELDRCLAEFRRATKPGGQVALKDIDGYGITVRTTDPSYLWRAHERFRSWERFRGSWRNWNLQRFLERAGLKEVWSQNTLIEHRAPLSDIERQSLSNFWCSVFAPGAVELTREAGVEGEELQFWIDLRDDTADSILNHPDLYATEGQILAVGRVPNDNGK